MTTKIENAYVYNTGKRCFEYGSLCFENEWITGGVLFPDAVIDAVAPFDALQPGKAYTYSGGAWVETNVEP